MGPGAALCLGVLQSDIKWMESSTPPLFDYWKLFVSANIPFGHLLQSLNRPGTKCILHANHFVSTRPYQNQLCTYMQRPPSVMAKKSLCLSYKNEYT